MTEHSDDNRPPRNAGHWISSESGPSMYCPGPTDPTDVTESWGEPQELPDEPPEPTSSDGATVRCPRCGADLPPGAAPALGETPPDAAPA